VIHDHAPSREVWNLCVNSASPRYLNGRPPGEGPGIRACTDTLGGRDKIITNSKFGDWSFLAGKADAMTLVIPEKGATFRSDALPGCKITFAPTGPVDAPGTYSSSAGTDTVTRSDCSGGQRGLPGKLREFGRGLHFLA
jgi:hypothetical protein